MISSVLKLLFIGLLLVLTFTLPAYADPYADGRKAYEEGDHATAIEIWKPLAEAGEAWAQYSIANLYMEGLGVDKNLVAASYWLERAAFQGFPLAQYRLGNAYREGYGFKKDNAEAVRWWRYAADEGIKDAMYNLGVNYYYGHGVEQNRATAYEWLQKAAEAGHELAQDAILVAQAGIEAELIENIDALEPKTAASEAAEAAAPLESGAVDQKSVHAEVSSDIEADSEIESLELYPAGTGSSPAIAVTGITIQPESWILGQAPEHYTMQLAAMSDLAGVERYLRKYNFEGTVSIYERKSGSKTVMVIILNTFPDLVAAEQSLAQLPESIRTQRVWIRTFSEIQAVINTR